MATLQAASSAAAVFNPVLELKKEDVEQSNEQVLVSAEVQTPIVTGVEPVYAEKFVTEFEALLKKDVLDVADLTAKNLPNLAHYCDGLVDGKCVNKVRFMASKAQIYKEYATISYELGVNILGGAPSTLVRSLTMDLRTGELSAAEDFVKDPLDQVRATGIDGKCLTDFDSLRAVNGKVEAFSPTDDGLYLSWNAGTFDATVCSVAHVLIPWAASPAQTESAPVTTRAAAGPVCAGDPVLPEGIDGRVCAATVDGATPLHKGEFGSGLVMSPTQNIWCGFRADFIECATIEPNVRIALGHSGAAEDRTSQDGPPGDSPVTLNYGETITFDQYACVSQEIGLSCWNTQTRHGLFLSRVQSIMW